MQEAFNRILVIIDFSKASLHAAEEAALIASKFNSQLHLLNVAPNSTLSYLLAPEAYFFEVAEDDKEILHTNFDKLKKLKNQLADLFQIEIECHEATGKLCNAVNKYASNLNVDLIVIGAKKENWFKELFFESKAKSLIKCVDKEVLCVYPDSNSVKLKKIVLPVGKFIPKRKIRLAYELAKRFAANVHLISLNKNGNGLSSEETKILMGSYQYLKDITNIPIECRTVHGDSLAQATVHYAENIGADLILVNAGAESDFKGAVLRRWGNIVNHSSVPVLSVHAINNKTNHRA
jgi:nucleotide-binding universal stress UspA family protein